MSELETLSDADWPAAVALAHAVGWRDSVADWEGLASVGRAIGLREGSALVATGVLCQLGGTATVAKMLVHPTRQRRGLGERLLRAVLALAPPGGPVALVATPEGRGLYLKYGFVPVEPIAIFSGVPVRGACAALPGLTDFEAACALDAAVTGASRRPLLERRWARAEHRVGLWRDGALVGLGLRIQQGDGFLIGPIHAPDEASALTLIRGLLPDDGRRGRVDLVTRHAALVREIHALGLVEAGTRDEMTLGGVALPGRRAERVAPLALAVG